MHIGMIVFGTVCQAAGMFLVKRQGVFSISLWLGVVLAMLAAVHMYRFLERSLDLGEEAASKMIFRGYLIRYALLALILAVIGATGILNPLAVFLGYMGLKVSAFLQPFTHRFTNRYFKEKDPEAGIADKDEDGVSF